LTDARRLYFPEPGAVELRTESIGDPAPDEVTVETTVSAISNGTERLVYRGEVPEGMTIDPTLSSFAGSFGYPLRYGYAAVGEVTGVGSEVDPDWVGQRVFAFEPHADRFHASLDVIVPLPEDFGEERAALLPTVETATNLVLDGAPRIGERVVVLGAGGIGLATVDLLAAYPLEELVVIDPVADRRDLARSMGADRALGPGAEAGLFEESEAGGADLVYELSGRPSTLDAAVDAVGYDGRVVVGSWYGTKRHAVDLGGSFHRDRIELVSSQVSTIAPDLRGRWTTDRRLEVALDRLRTLETDRLVTHRVPFSEAHEAYRLLDRGPDDALQVLLTYQ
jgi:2-desacetyl-2-hydroxyethyl bacteriochlorophyllide A dehydrogenase